jgi:hypothetical protein
LQERRVKLEFQHRLSAIADTSERGKDKIGSAFLRIVLMRT